MKSLLLVVSDDHWGRRAAQLAQHREDILVAVNRGTNPRRIVRLLWRRSIPPSAFIKMVFAEWSRPRVDVAALPEIHDNEDLLTLAGSHDIRNVILFRAGVIVSGRTMSNLNVLNVHCAKLGRYGGLASIARALSDGALDQDATLHRITTRIDEGEVLDFEPYRLDARLSYRENEDRAYEAGLVLLDRTFGRSAVSAS